MYNAITYILREQEGEEIWLKSFIRESILKAVFKDVQEHSINYEN